MAAQSRVMVVDDDGGFQELVAITLRRAGFEALTPPLQTWAEHVRHERPDALLLDLSLHHEHEAVGEIAQLVASCPATMVAALTGHSAEELEQTTLAAGAFVYYEKAMLQHLPGYLADDLALFRRALDGEEVVAPAAVRRRTAA